MNNKSRLEKRAKIVNYIYSHLVMEKSLDSKQAFESGEFNKQETKIIDNISKSLPKLEKIASEFLKANWSWDRILPLEKAIIIYGSFEMLFNDKALVINEMVDITKGYIPGDSYKFINGILNKIGEHYEQKNKNN